MSEWQGLHVNSARPAPGSTCMLIPVPLQPAQLPLNISSPFPPRWSVGTVVDIICRAWLLTQYLPSELTAQVSVLDGAKLRHVLCALETHARQAARCCHLPSLLVPTLRPRAVKPCVQGHTATKWQGRRLSGRIHILERHAKLAVSPCYAQDRCYLTGPAARLCRALSGD